LPEARAALVTAVIHDALYVIGGFDGHQSRTELFRLSLGNTQWERLPAMTVARDHLAAVSDGQVLYVLGGRENGDYAKNVTAVETFDPTTTAWSTSADLPIARSGHAAAIANGRMIVAGGENPSGTIGAVDVYDLMANVWTSYPALPEPRHGLGVVTLPVPVELRQRYDFEEIHVVGGGPTPGLSVSGAHHVFRFIRPDALFAPVEPMTAR
jgi:N-acetylneuraminic acid mutarotase